MKERFKQQLTHHVMLEDYSQKTEKQRSGGYSGFTYVLMLLFCIAMPLIGVPVCLFLLYKGSENASSAPMPEDIQENDFIVSEDTCIDHYEESGCEEGSTYYLRFRQHGNMIVPKVGPASRTFRPGWDGIKVGDSFYAVTIRNVRNYLVFYSMKEWRREPLSEEDLQIELQGEDAYILQAMTQCRFPKLVARSEMFTDSPTYFKVSSNKTREQRNIVEQMAAQYFSCDLLLALEYILRYCPPHMQERFSEDYTPDQLRLSNIIADHIKDEKKREKAKQNKEKIKAFFKGNDYND